jgi:hypothetical protein
MLSHHAKFVIQIIVLLYNAVRKLGERSSCYDVDMKIESFIFYDDSIQFQKMILISLLVTSISSNFNWIHGDQDIPRSYIYIS